MSYIAMSLSLSVFEAHQLDSLALIRVPVDSK